MKGSKMKIIKKSTLALMIISLSANILPRSGWVGPVLGTAAVLGTVGIATRDRSPEGRNIRSINRDIAHEERQKNMHEYKIRAARRDYNKGKIDRDERDDRIARHENKIEEHKGNITDLRRQRTMVIA